MKFLDKIERHFGFLAVPNVVLGLVAAQVCIYAAILLGRVDYGAVLLDPRAIFAGEWWRLFSFLIAPPFVAVSAVNAVFLAFYWYVFWMMSSALESVWGTFRFNVYLLLGIFLTVAGSLIGQIISPRALIQASTMEISISVFFAFATLHPNVEFLVMFILPVKVKWLARFGGIMTALAFLAAPSLGHKLTVLAPLLNYFIFFYGTLRQSVHSQQRRRSFETTKRKQDSEALHTCSQCGATEQSHPDRDFRYKVVDGDAVCLCGKCRANAESEK